MMTIPDDLTNYKKTVSNQWDREITEGATIPTPVTKNTHAEKEKLSTLEHLAFP